MRVLKNPGVTPALMVPGLPVPTEPMLGPDPDGLPGSDDDGEPGVEPPLPEPADGERMFPVHAAEKSAASATAELRTPIKRADDHQTKRDPTRSTSRKSFRAVMKR
jgi:hypothetical protein